MPSETVPSALRPLQPGDLPAIRDVIDSRDLFPPAMMDDMTAAYLGGTAPDELWLVAPAPAPAALAYCAPERMTDGTWNVLLIAVHASRHRQGLGRALMAGIEARLAERGARIVLVETSGLPSFDDTRAFYRGLGYEQEARVRDFYADGEDKIVFRKALSPARPDPVRP